MSDRDELMLEKGKIKGAQSYIAPGQITNLEIQTGAIAAGDIVDAAVTKEKINVSVAGNGIAGGAGTALSADCDAATLTAVGGTISIKALGITAAKLAAGTKGAGMVAGAGTGFAVDVDTTTVEINAGAVRLVDAGTAKAKLADDAKKHNISIKLPQFVAGAPNTVRCGVLAVPTGCSYKITKAELSAFIAPIDMDGTCNVRLVYYDVSAVVDKELVAPWNAENLVTKIGTALNITVAPAGIDTLQEHDMLWCELISDTVGIDTAWSNPVLSIEYLEV
jgi:hypothetical protein